MKWYQRPLTGWQRYAFIALALAALVGLVVSQPPSTPRDWVGLGVSLVCAMLGSHISGARRAARKRSEND